MTDNGGQRYVPPDGDHNARKDAADSWFMPSGDRHRTQSQYQDSYDDAGAAEGGDAGRSGTPGAQLGEEGPEQPRPDGDRPRSAFPNSGGYPGLGGDRPAMAEPYPSALGDLGLPGDPRGAGGGSAAGGQDQPPLTRPYAAPSDDGGRPAVRGSEDPPPAAGPDDGRSGPAFGDADRGSASGPGGGPPEPGTGAGSTVAGYRLPDTSAAAPGNAPLSAVEGAGGYPGFGSTARSGAGEGVADGAPDAQSPEPSAGTPQGYGGSAEYGGAAEWGQAGAAPYGSGPLGGGTGPDTEPFPSGGDPEADRRNDELRSGAADRSVSGDRAPSGGPSSAGPGPVAAGPGGDRPAQGSDGYPGAPGEPAAPVGEPFSGAWGGTDPRARSEAARQVSADPASDASGWDTDLRGPGAYETPQADRAADAPRSAESAPETGGSSAYADQRVPRGGFEEARWTPTGADPAGTGERPFDYGTGSTAGEPRRYASGAAYRLDPEPGPLPHWEPGAEQPGGAGGSDAYGDELSRPYSRRIQPEEDPYAGSASSWSADPYRDPADSLGGDGSGLGEPQGSGSDRAAPGAGPAPGAGIGQDGGPGSGTGNTWAFSRDDTRLPEDVRQAVEEQRRKRRDGSPEHTTAGFARTEGEGGFPDRSEARPGGTPTGAPATADLGDDPLAAIAAQQARARAAEGSGWEAAPGEGSAAGQDTGAGMREAPAAADELGPDLRGPGYAPAGDELGPDPRGPGYGTAGDELGPDPRAGESADRQDAPGRGGGYGELDAYGRHAPSAASDGGYGGYGQDGPEDPQAAEPGAHGYGSYEPQGRDPGGYGGDQGYTPSGPERRGSRARHDDPAGEAGAPYTVPEAAPAPFADGSGPGEAVREGRDTAAMDVHGLGAYEDGAHEGGGAYASAPGGGAHADGYGYGGIAADGADAAAPGGSDGAPEDAAHGEQDRRARSSRDPIGEDFPHFDRLPGGTAGDDYPGYDNIDHWPDTAPEASAVLWLGIAALVPVIGLLTGIAALVMGPRATRAIRRSQGELEGRNLVRLGTILAWAGIGLFVVETVVYVGVFVLS